MNILRVTTTDDNEPARPITIKTINDKRAHLDEY